MLNLLKKQTKFSFLMDGKPFSEFAHTVTTEELDNTVKTVYSFDCGLRVTNTLRFYPAFGACDWVNTWENIGNEPTPVISALWDADVTLPFAANVEKETRRAYLPQSEHVIKVYAPTGSNWSAEEFYCDVDCLVGNRYQNWLREGEKNTYASSGGRCADSDHSPFFHIRHGKEDMGIFAAIGWTGQWNAEIERNETAVIFKSKIEDTEFCMLPGECFRTASATLMEYRGTVADGHNQWRRFIKEIYSPIGKGQIPSLAPFCANLWGGMSSASCVERIRKVEEEKFPFDHYWMDAGWYGSGVLPSPDEYEGDWAQHVGNWEINKLRHPDGLTDVVNEIDKSNKRFIFWIEPERIRDNAPIVKEHPEYLLFWDMGTRLADTTLLNLGDEAAWNYCFETVSELIERLHVSVYRQDFNIRPLPFWHSNDTENRKGITEIKYINGLYKFWDALLTRFPHLLIDNCASGGRRIDIETLRRSVPLWRSDAQCPANPLPEITQAHALSHSAYFPYSGTSMGRVWFDTYRFRSAYAPALATNFTFSEKDTFGDDPKKMEWLHKMCAEFIRVRPYLSEDVYPLTTPTASADVWSAIQYHDPKKNEGVLQIFRREHSPYQTACFTLGGIDSAKDYVFEDADGGTFTASGKELTEGWELTVKERRAAKLYFYRAKD